MDYTSLVQVLGIIGDGGNPTPRPIPAPYDDTVIAEAIKSASRAIDRLVTGSPAPSAVDYFATGTLTNEQLKGTVNKDGDIIIRLHKPNCSVPSALVYRYRPTQDWSAPITTSLITVEDYTATVWLGNLYRGEVMIKTTYAGGLAATPATLPEDLQRAAAILAARYFKEGKTGLTDLIGVAELGIVQYTLAIPREVETILDPYVRPTPW